MEKHPEREKKSRAYTRQIAAFAVLGIGVVAFFLLNIGIGSVSIPLRGLLACVSGKPVSDTVYGIVWNIRLPRAAAVLILGGALALAGYLLQTFFHNPIAGPFVLGISSGAKLTVSLVMVFLL